MTGKEFLQRLSEASRTLESKVEQLKRIQALAHKITTVINGTPSVNSQSQSRIENAVVNVLQESDNVENCVKNFFALRQTAVACIEKIPNNDERIILEYRYLSNKSWKEISDIMNLSLRYTYSLHGNALISFEKFFNLEDKKAQKSTNSTLTNDL